MNLSKSDKAIMGICAGVLLGLLLLSAYKKMPKAMGDQFKGTHPVAVKQPVPETVESIGENAAQVAKEKGYIK